MKVVKKIKPRDWILWPECQRIMSILNTSHAAEVTSLFVGGCVRDLVLGKLAQDIDIATIYSPERVQHICLDAGLNVIPTGLKHGTVTVLMGTKNFEVTTLRRDIATDGRRATVAFTDSWMEDAVRRDFTMNALYASVDGDVYDPTSQGLKDLEAGYVRFISNAEARIKEDYLRILRFFRFNAYYGAGGFDQSGLMACQKFSSKLSSLSRERITQEFYKILMAPQAPFILKEMQQSGVLKDAIPGDLSQFKTLIDRQEHYDCLDLNARLYLTLQQAGLSFEDAERKFFIFTNAQKKVFQTLQELGVEAKTQKYDEERLYYNNPQIFIQHLLLFAPVDCLSSRISFAKGWHPPSFPLSGEDLIDLGVKKGPEFGALLSKTELWWVKKGFQPDKEACLEYLRAFL